MRFASEIRDIILNMSNTSKHAGGRPSKYDPKFIDKVEEYIKTTGKEQMELPTKEGFALYIGVDDDTLDNWANERVKNKKGEDTSRLLRPEFFGALKNLMMKQKTQLVNDGIYGGKEVNSTIVKLLLQNNHGMKEKIDATSDNEKISGLVVTIVEDKQNE